MVDLAFGSFQDRMTLEGSTVKKFVAWPCTTANIKAPNAQQITLIQCSKPKISFKNHISTLSMGNNNHFN